MSDATLTDVHPRSAAVTSANLNEDWLALILGLLIFVVALGGLFQFDVLGWVVTTSVSVSYTHLDVYKRQP